MFKLTRRSLWEHKRRLILTLVAIALGVGFMAGTFVLTDTMDKAFDDLFATGSEEIDAQVQGEILFSDPFSGMGDQRRLIDASVLDDVRAVDGVAEAEPFVITIGFGASNRVLGKDGEAIGATQGPPTLLENWYDNPDLSAYELTEGRGPEADDEIALNVLAVEDGDLAVGGPVRVLTQFGEKTYTLVGQFLFAGEESSAGAVSADFTLAEAQRLAGTDGKVQQIVAKAEDGISQQELVDRITPVLPDGAEAITGVEAGEQLSSDVQSGFAFFSTILSVFGGVALLVGIFVISNTFSILVAQRTRELALLRAIGARRGQVLRSVLVEAVLVGLIGALFGLAFGILLALGVVSLFSAIGADLPTDGLALRPGTVITALVIGVVVTLVASLAPAIRSTKVAPIAALRDVAFERTGPSKVRIGIGLLVLALGALNLTAGWQGGSDTEDVPVVGLGGALLLVSAIIVGPVLAGRTVRLMGSLLPRFRGIQGRLATENASRSPKRTSATASALIIGMTLVGLISIFSASAEASVTDEVGRGFEGNFAVQAGGGFTGPSAFPTIIADEVAKVPGVEAAVGLGFARAELTLSGGKTVGQFISGIDPTQVDGVLDPRMTEGLVTDLTDDGVIVDVGEADDHGLEIGDTVTMTFGGGGTKELTVEAISDEENLLGYYTISRTTFLANQPNPQDFMVFGKADPDRLDEVIAAVDDVIEGVPTLKVVDRDGFIGSIADQITQIVNVFQALLVLSVIIATIGIANTLSLAIHERTRELGLLRAVGMTRVQLRSSIRWEAVLISILGTGVGLVLSLVISRCLLQALKSSGLTIWKVPTGLLIQMAIVSVIVGVVAAFFPARRAARMAVLDAIAKS